MQSNCDFDIPTYLAWCKRFDLIPCSPEEFLTALKLAAPNELPYRDLNGLIRLHDINQRWTSRILADAIFSQMKK
jgi:hypothetical protein